MLSECVSRRTWEIGLFLNFSNNCVGLCHPENGVIRTQHAGRSESESRSELRGAETRCTAQLLLSLTCEVTAAVCGAAAMLYGQRAAAGGAALL
eukprot:361897-Chlamydomonas_euryale.AAC.2